MEDPYRQIGHLNDDIVGDQRETIRYLKRLIRKHAPRAESILEIACGTGAIHSALSDSFDIEDSIPESTYPLETAQELLSPFFTVRSVQDSERAQRTVKSGRLYCVCEAAWMSSRATTQCGKERSACWFLIRSPSN
ncbi:hypothetical protein MRY87_02510 [bacterium]|nr:hypothetical protein [bacterium]